MLNVTTTCMELHKFRGLCVLRLGSEEGGGELEIGLSTVDNHKQIQSF